MPETERRAGEASPASDVFEAGLSEAERGLRERAQAEVRTRSAADSAQGSEASAPEVPHKLLHELRVHQIELEMQNEELRRAQLELEASRARYFELYDLAPVGYLTIAEKGLVVEANLTAAGMLGLSRGELVKQPWTRFIVPEDQDAYLRHRRTLLTSGAPQSCELRLLKNRAEPHWTRLDSRLAYHVDGTVELRTTLSDIDERKRSHEKLRLSEARHRLLFEDSREALLTLSPPSWRFGSANKAALALFGSESAEELCARTLWDYSPTLQPDGRLSHEKALSQIEQTMKAGVHSFEWTCERAPGDSFRATVTLSKIEVEGAPLLQAAVRNESEAERERASRAQMERLASMGMLAASVGHEINNPLAYTLSSLEALTGELTALNGSVEHTPAALQEMTGHARNALNGAQRIARISRVLNTFSRVEQHELSTADLNRAITSAITLASNEVRFRAELVTELGPVPKVWASEGKLSQVFLNLLINASHAVEALPVGGQRITIRTWADGSHVLAEVTDTGVGIPPEMIEHVFEPFFSTKRIGQGSGLGLSICRSILAEFAGDIRVESTVSNGTRFVIRLPVCFRQPPVASLEVAGAAPAPATPGRILLVDDEELLLLTMKRLLREHEVVSVSSAREAKAVLTEDTDFDLVLCDLMMPDMTGIELHQWLASYDARLAKHLVFVTGGAIGTGSAEYLAASPNFRIDKPFDGDSFQRVVSERLRLAQRAYPSPTRRKSTQ